MTAVFAHPGALSTVADPSPMSWKLLAAFGYRWVALQAQNGGNNPVDYDLASIRRDIESVGVWGVTYAKDDKNSNPRGLTFYEQNHILGRQAMILRADHVIVDAEECAKVTRDTDGLREVIHGLSAAGWTGPVSLSTLGAPSNPDVNDFQIDTESFLETGGFVLPQAYANDWPDQYMPADCVRYWTRVGVPRDRLNLTISLTAGDTSKRRLAGPEWVPLLQAAKLGPAFSLFMAEYATLADIAGLEPLTKTPPQPDGPTKDQTRQAIVDAVGAQVHHWHHVERRTWPWIKRELGIYRAGNQVAPETFPLP